MPTSHFMRKRRQLLRGGALLGLSTALPAMLAACGSGGSDDPSAEAPEDTNPREAATLHFDLSAAPIAEAHLRLYGSASHRVALVAHDSDSRERHRQRNALLADVRDDQLTHYLEAVDLPAGALQLASVWGVHPATGAPVLAGQFLHVPTASLQKLAGAQQAPDPLLPPLVAKSPAWDVATCLVFQHPSITNLDPDLGADIVQRIQNLPTPDNPYLGTLAFQIAVLISAAGYPSTTANGSWATLVPLVDQTTGQTKVDGNGDVIYSYKVNDAISDATATVVRNILGAITNDAKFAGTNWQSPDGGQATEPVPNQLAAAVADAFTIAASIPVGKRVSGIRMDSLSATDGRAVRLGVRNYFLRAASVYVEYIDQDGNVLPAANPGDIDTATAKFAGLVQPDEQLMGIPFQGDEAPATDINFTMPGAARQAVVYFGGLGLGGSDAFSPMALMGTIMTLTVNIALPTLCLTLGIGSFYNKGLATAINDALTDPSVTATVLKAVASMIEGGEAGAFTQAAVGKMTLEPALVGLASAVLQILLNVAPRLSILLSEAVAGSAVENAIPFVGLALWALSTAADIATIGETVIECVSCPAIDRNVISLSMTSTVRINRDPADFQFPATARRYDVVANYGGSTARTVSGTLTTGQTDPINAVLSGVPSGGTVQVNVTLYDDRGTLVGSGLSDVLVNVPATAATIPVTITELLVPLDATTRYVHQTKLVYANGAHAWSATAPVPALTRANLCSGNDGAICALQGLTVHTASGMAGYGYNAGGQGIGLCGGGSASSMNVIANVFLGSNAQGGVKTASCGETQPIGIAYSPAGVLVKGNNFFLQQGADGFYHLRGVSLDNTNFDMAQQATWGRFMSPMESLVVTSNGYVVGVNRATHKIEVLMLPQAPDPSRDPAKSATFSASKAGKGSLAGRLDTPVAVATYSGNILVLEQGNARVQAFDTDGSNVDLFLDGSGKPSPLMPLQAESGVTYLDIAAEGAGYVYILSYLGSGNVPTNYRLDVYTPTGAFLSRTTGLAAGNIAVDLFRNLYTLNYESVAGAPRVEPSLSQWLPHSTLSATRGALHVAAIPGAVAHALA